MEIQVLIKNDINDEERWVSVNLFREDVEIRRNRNDPHAGKMVRRV